jgi:hypothetical protein
MITNTLMVKSNPETWQRTPDALFIADSGSYVNGVVEFRVPFQQYLEKHCTQTSGVTVPVLLMLLVNIAHDMQAGHSLSIVPLACVATL